MRIRRLVLAAGLIVIAVSLAVALLQNRTNHITGYTDGTTVRTVNADPILTGWTDVIDVGCLAGGQCRVSGMEDVHGIYPRDGVPWFLGLIGGIVLPYGFICIGGYVALAHTSGAARITIASGLVVASAILLSPAAFIAYRGTKYGYLENGDLSGVLFAVSVLGGTTAVGAAWLFAARPHKMIQEAFEKT